MGKQPATIPCPVCRESAERYFARQRVQTTAVLWRGGAPQEIPVRRKHDNPIGALAYV
jgi:hypothetical protein